MAVIALGIHRQQLLRPFRGFFGVAQGSQIAFLDQCGIICTQAERKRHGKQCVAILGILYQKRTCTALRLVERKVKAVANARIRGEFLAGIKSFVVFVELRFQHAQPLKFREQQSRRIRSGTDRILGMLPLPGGKELVRPIELQVIHKPEALVEGRVGHADIGSPSG